MSALIELENASIMLRARRVVNGANVKVERGAIVALLGPNGAGKTSLIRGGMGLIPVKTGEARIYGAPSRDMSPPLRARRAAYLPQQPEAAWPIRVEALAALGRFPYGGLPGKLAKDDARAVDWAIEACGLGPLRERRLDELSGGERIRAHLARALAQGAPLLVLDEPTAGLDPAQTLIIADILRAHAGKEGGVLFSTHDIALAARLVHEVVLLKAGETVAQGAPGVALTSEALTAAYGRPGEMAEIAGAPAVAFR